VGLWQEVSSSAPLEQSFVLSPPITKRCVHDHIYVAAGRNRAFTFHHAPISALGVDQLEVLLQEQHTQAEWVRLLHGLNQAVSEAEQAKLELDLNTNLSVLDAATPGRKRKARYDAPPAGALMVTPSRGGPKEDLQESFEEELVILSSEDSSDQSEDGKLRLVLTQWDVLVNLVNRLGSGLKRLKVTVGQDLFDLNSKWLTVDANLGRKPRDCGLDDCASAWDGLAFLASQVKELEKAEDQARDDTVRTLETIDSRVTTGVAGHQIR
jgi:hypothetical protein